MHADEKPTADGLPKPLVVPFVAGLIGTVLLCGLMLFVERNRFDATVYLWCAISIALIFLSYIPVNCLQKKLQERARRKPFLPWPRALTNPLFDKPAGVSGLHLSGSFVWTPRAFSRLAKAWARHTPEGRRYRRTITTLTSIGLAGIVLATAFLWQREWSAIALIVASAVLLLFAFDCRISPPREVRTLEQVHWEILPERFVIGTNERRKVVEWPGVQAVLQTPHGFLIWPGDFVEICLPAGAFANAGELEAFGTIAQSKVRNFVRID